MILSECHTLTLAFLASKTNTETEMNEQTKKLIEAADEYAEMRLDEALTETERTASTSEPWFFLSEGYCALLVDSSIRIPLFDAARAHVVLELRHNAAVRGGEDNKDFADTLIDDAVLLERLAKLQRDTAKTLLDDGAEAALDLIEGHSMMTTNIKAITDASLADAFNGFAFDRDERQTPDNLRRFRFGQGWRDAAELGKEYSDETLKTLTWQNLGYRLGKVFGHQRFKEISSAFDFFEAELDTANDTPARH